MLCFNKISMYYSMNSSSHSGGVSLQACVLCQSLEVEMWVQYVLILVLKLLISLNVYSLMMRGREEDGARLFSVVPSGRTRCNGHKHKCWKCLLNARKALLL